MQEETNFDYIASFIRSFRSARGESLQVMAKRSGVSRSMIAQIEAGQTSPTLAVLAKLAKAMDIRLGDLVQPPEHAFGLHVAEPTATNIVSKKNSVFVCHLLLTQNRHFATETYRFYFKRQGKTNFAANITGSVKQLWLEEGALCVHIASQRIEVKPGTMVCFNASVPHRFECRAEKLAKGLFFVAY